MELLIVNKKGEKFTVLYDEQDHDMVTQHKWSINAGGYAVATSRGDKSQKMVLMHRLILASTNPKIFTDHKNQNKIDNRRENLRLCTRAQNRCNARSWGSSRYLGVCVYIVKGVRTERTYIRANIKSFGPKKHLGYFKTEEDAARAYDEAAKELHGEFANLNFPNL